MEVGDDGIALTLQRFGDIARELAESRTPVFGLRPMRRSSPAGPRNEREAFITPALLCAVADALRTLAYQVADAGARVEERRALRAPRTPRRR